MHNYTNITVQHAIYFGYNNIISNLHFTAFIQESRKSYFTFAKLLKSLFKL